ncbi:MAG: PaaI family thioesterase [Gammaproteobacteria bacterium]|nr:PaaI family thioesterase [Gammaproteobacteria bacterium]
MNSHEIPNHWTGQCFGCSRTNAHGLQLHFWLSDRGCFTKCVIPDYLCGIDGLVHGGIIALLLDEVAQWTLIGRHAKFGVTREISVRYLKPVPTNTELLVEAQIVNRDDKNVVLRSTICITPDVPLAEGESKWLLVNPSTVAKLSAVDESTLRRFLSQYEPHAED